MISWNATHESADSYGMKMILGIAIAFGTVVAAISADKALGLSTKLVTTFGITPK